MIRQTLALVALAACASCSSEISVGSPSSFADAVPKKPRGTATIVVSSGSNKTVHGRRPAFVSPSIAYIGLTDGKNSKLIACATHPRPFNCVVTIATTAGEHEFLVATFDSSQTLLSSVVFKARIDAGQDNELHCVLNGVISQLELTVPQQPLLNGKASTVKIRAIAKDADGNIIVGPGQYDAFAVVANSDTTGALRLATPTVLRPGQDIDLFYDGRTPANATITATWPVPGGQKASSSAFVYPIVPTTEVKFDKKPSGAATGSMIASPDGSFWFSERDALAHVTSTGVLKEVRVDSGVGDLAVDPSGNVWFDVWYGWTKSPPPNLHITKVSPDGKMTAVSLAGTVSPSNISPIVFAYGSLWFYEQQAATNGPVMYRMSTAGVITQAFVISAKGWGTGNAFGLVLDQNGHFWINGGPSLVTCDAFGKCAGHASALTADYGRGIAFGQYVGWLAPLRGYGFSLNGKMAFSWNDQGEGALAGGKQYLFTGADVRSSPHASISVIDSHGNQSFVADPESLDGTNYGVEALAAAPDGKVWFVRGGSVGYFDFPSD